MFNKNYYKIAYRENSGTVEHQFYKLAEKKFIKVESLQKWVTHRKSKFI
jgi:hypothetical protein